jgi:hypothetical protein
MDLAEGVARARAALAAAERLLLAPVGMEADTGGRAALQRHLGELRRLLTQLEEGNAPARRGDPTADGHDVGTG